MAALVSSRETPVREAPRSADRTFGAVGAGAAGALGLVLIGIIVSVIRLAWPALVSDGTFWSTEWDRMGWYRNLLFPRVSLG